MGTQILRNTPVLSQQFELVFKFPVELFKLVKPVSLWRHTYFDFLLQWTDEIRVRDDHDVRRRNDDRRLAHLVGLDVVSEIRKRSEFWKSREKWNHEISMMSFRKNRFRTFPWKVKFE